MLILMLVWDGVLVEGGEGRAGIMVMVMVSIGIITLVERYFGASEGWDSV